jgi:hypothetical protein
LNQAKHLLKQQLIPVLQERGGWALHCFDCVSILKNGLNKGPKSSGSGSMIFCFMGFCFIGRLLSIMPDEDDVPSHLA